MAGASNAHLKISLYESACPKVYTFRMHCPTQSTHDQCLLSPQVAPAMSTAGVPASLEDRDTNACSQASRNQSSLISTCSSTLVVFSFSWDLEEKVE